MVPSKLRPPERPQLELKDYQLPPRPPLPPDDLGGRLARAVVVSIIVNAALWWMASGFVRNHIIAPPAPIEVRLLPPPVRKKPVVKKVVHKVVKPTPPKPKPQPKVKPIPKPLPKPPQKPVPVQHHPRPTPPQPHVHVMSVKGPATPHEPTVQPGGRAPLGKPLEQEGNSPTATTPATARPSNPEPPKPAPAPPAPAPEPKPEPAPKPAPPPAPAGPTQDAQPTHQVLPDIPDELKSDNYQSFVRVRVVIHADGTFTPYLRSSSGNVDIDQRVLDALKQWTWKPALKNGVPVESEQFFKFDFEVQ